MAQVAMREAVVSALYVAVPCFEPITRTGQWCLPLAHMLAKAEEPPADDDKVVWLIQPPVRLKPEPIPEPAIEPAPRRGGRRHAQLITPVMAAVDAVVRRHAAGCMAMPSNPVLGQLVGGRGRNTVWRALQRLVSAGRILIEVSDGKRRIWVRDSGQVTAWGPYSLSPHAPYSVTPRGTAPRQPTVVRPDLSGDEDEPARMRVEPMRLVEAEAAERCCWPMWQDDEAPTHLYCDTPLSPQQVRRRKPYCEAHS